MGSFQPIDLQERATAYPNEEQILESVLFQACFRCSALNSGSPWCTLTCFFSLICEDNSGSVEEQEEGTLPVPSLCLLNPIRHEPFKDLLDLHLQWHYMVLFDTKSDAIKCVVLIIV